MKSECPRISFCLIPYWWIQRHVSSQTLLSEAQKRNGRFVWVLVPFSFLI
jgi:hypothetical protein